MKKIRAVLIMIIMALAITTTAYAAETKLSVSNVEAKNTQMIYLTVSLNDCPKANTLGITMKYDSKVLKKVPGESTWKQNGTIADFDVAKNTGVWAIKKAQDLNGEICTLAFRVNADAPVGETKVTCEVIVKNNSKVIGTYTAEGIVTVTCEHSYGEWTEKDGDMHMSLCKYCQSQKTASHEWDKGQVTKEPTETGAGVKTYQCNDCNATKTAPIEALGSGSQGKPEDTEKPGNAGNSGNSGNSGNAGNTGSPEKPGNAGNQENPENSGNSGNLDDIGNSNNTGKPEHSERPSESDNPDKNDKDTIEPNKDDELEKEDAHISDDVDDSVLEEHVHTEDDNHSHEENVEGEEVNNYLWIPALVVIMGILFFVYKKMKNKK